MHTETKYREVEDFLLYFKNKLKYIKHVKNVISYLTVLSFYMQRPYYDVYLRSKLVVIRIINIRKRLSSLCLNTSLYISVECY